MKKLGPVGADKKKYFGYTRWYVKWNYRYVPVKNACNMQTFKATMTATMTLPRWNMPRDAPARLTGQWKRFKAALRLHEDGHYRIASAAAREINAIGKKKISAASCPVLKVKLDSAAEDVLEKYRRRESAYDAKTRHGKTQGAVFP